ncbi:carboxylesterase/lipase family protein [Novosphingobium flavum]|uniref:Carboxylic ester hydrolase n=1 Tax=Novosphingobium aerophilum TaxID=2839843 RepID=A0A7X1F9Q9_9SPHN|nr:carboxylesterase/lipase family protein [Novosphingobium aerophilum]MBC2652779.1 carboxylesterase/lipase family protein [Novosphingobium aerophilum]MBC2660830.1 carboxylesterase/lipase family protein [Novosphingobium aerophilum]
MIDLHLTRRALVAAMGATAMATNAPLLAKAAGGSKGLEVQTAQGRLRGKHEGKTKAFLGVPYAAPPVGPLRFRAPQPPKSWRGVRDAVTYGPPSIQNNRDHKAWVDPLPGSEDCLYLNVWVPDGKSPNKPVMVWFHGGGYESGSGGLPLYNGAALADHGDVVVVTVNHRLSLMGYLWLGDVDPSYASDSTPGQQDLVASLKWVRDNIAAFGGDPNNVTIFGESGGGGKVSALLATPSAKGLFHKAIVQSGSQQKVYTRAEASEITKIALSAVDLKTPTAAALSALPNSALWTMMLAVGKLPGLAFQPVVDGAFMPHQTWQDAAPPESLAVPMMIGVNADESVAFLPDMRKEPKDDAEMRARFAGSMGGKAFTDEEWGRVIQRYRALLPNASRLDLLVAMSSDFWMRSSAQNQAEKKVKQGGAPVFVYEFGWKTPCFGGSWSLHGIEIPFVFGNLDYGVAWDGEDSEASRAAADPKRDRFRLAAQTMSAWAAFAHSGNPSTPEIPWPAFDLQRRATLVLDREIKVVDDLHHDRRVFAQTFQSAW